MPEDVDGAIWRVYLHPRTKDTLTDIQERWSFEDLTEANEVLDALEDAEARADVSA